MFFFSQKIGKNFVKKMGNLVLRIPDLLFEIGWIQKFGQKKNIVPSSFRNQVKICRLSLNFGNVSKRIIVKT